MPSRFKRTIPIKELRILQVKISFLLKSVIFLTNAVRDTVSIVRLIPVVSYKDISYLSLLTVMLITCVEGKSMEEEGDEG